MRRAFLTFARPLALSCVLALAWGAHAARANEVLERHIALLGLAQAAGEGCGMKVRLDQIQAIQQRFPQTARPDGTFQPTQVEQLTGAITAGRIVIQSFPAQRRCEFAEGWFGANGSIAPLLERQ